MLHYTDFVQLYVVQNTECPHTNQKYVNKGQKTAVIERLQRDWMSLFLSLKSLAHSQQRKRPKMKEKIKYRKDDVHMLISHLDNEAEA